MNVVAELAGVNTFLAIVSLERWVRESIGQDCTVNGTRRQSSQGIVFSVPPDNTEFRRMPFQSAHIGRYDPAMR